MPRRARSIGKPVIHMEDKQVMHAMSLDDAYHVERVLARGAGGVTEIVSIGGTGPFVRKKIPLQLARRNVWSTLGECSGSRLPHVEATYELPDCFVVVVDYVEGDPLEDVVSRRGRFALHDAIALMGQIGEAVGELHAHGIVHRDLSPKNIIIAADGAHIIDLGIARMRAEHTGGHDTTILGTWGFAPAEQYGFAQTDDRSDIYSMGRLLGYALTGCYPTDSEYERLLDDDTVVDAHTRSVIARACALEPSARQQTVGQFVDELSGKTPIPESEDGTDSRMARDAAADTRQTTGGSTAEDGFVKRLRSKMRAMPSTTRVACICAMLVCAALVIALLAGASMGVYRHFAASGASNAAETARNDDASGTSQNKEGTSEPSQSRNDVAQSEKSRSAATGNPLAIGESGWHANGGYVHYAYELRNTSASTVVAFPQVTAVGKDGNGNILFSEDYVGMRILPEQTVWVTGQAGNGGEDPASVTFRTADPSADNMTENKNEKAWRFTTSALHANQGDGTTNFSGEIGVGSRGDGSDGSQVRVSLVLRGKDGSIVYGDLTYVPLPSDGRRQSFTIMEPTADLPAYSTFEVHAQLE